MAQAISVDEIVENRGGKSWSHPVFTPLPVTIILDLF